MDVPPSHQPHPEPNQFALLGQRRFAPYFWAQVLGTANAHLFRFALAALLTHQLSVPWLPVSEAWHVLGATAVLPLLLFASSAGQLADKYDKAQLLRLIKTLELGVMALAAWGWLHADPGIRTAVLLACLALMGLHAALSAPARLSYLPQHLGERELTGGSALATAGSLAAVLAGHAAATRLAGGSGVDAPTVAFICFSVAVLGRLAVQAVPSTPAPDPGLRLRFAPVRETWQGLRIAYASKVVFRSMLGLAWLAFFGSIVLDQIPSLSRQVLHGNAMVPLVLLVILLGGFALGALLCEVLSLRHAEIGLVPLGGLGMSLSLVDLWFAVEALQARPADLVLSVSQFLAVPGHWRVMADLALLALSTGFYCVPMIALIQARCMPTHRGRIVAANTVLCVLFMAAAVEAAAMLVGAGVGAAEILLLTALANFVVAGYIVLLVPEYLLRFMALLIARGAYRLRVAGDTRFPSQGPVIVVANHVSYVDAVVLAAACPRPIRFIMDHRIFAVPLLGWLFRMAKVIPIAPQKDDPACYEAAFVQARQVLDEGDVLGIFPEGALTSDGRLHPFKGGIMKILASHPAPVLPVALCNLWGSTFSRIEGGHALARPLRRGLFSRVDVIVGSPIAPEQVTPELLRARVQSLLDVGDAVSSSPPLATPPTG